MQSSRLSDNRQPTTVNRQLFERGIFDPVLVRFGSATARRGTVRAIRSWRFKPMIRDGQKQEVIHELTIQYRLHEEG